MQNMIILKLTVTILFFWDSPLGPLVGVKTFAGFLVISEWFVISLCAKLYKEPQRKSQQSQCGF